MERHCRVALLTWMAEAPLRPIYQGSWVVRIWGILQVPKTWGLETWITRGFGDMGMNHLNGAWGASLILK